MRVLQSGGKFEAVSGNDAVVGVGSRNERRWIVRSRFQVVVGRIRVQRCELRGVVGRTEIVGPEAAGRELMKSQHVHHADTRQTRTEQIRPLRHAGSDEQPAVAASLDRELLGPGVTVLDEMADGEESGPVASLPASGFGDAE